MPNNIITKIVYPDNLIKADSRYGNQFMALHINITPTPGGSDFSGSSTRPKSNDVNGNIIHQGSIINKFTDTSILDTARKGGNIRATNQGSQTVYSIYLPVPLALSTSFGMEYSNFDPGTKAAEFIQTQAVGAVGAAAEGLAKIPFVGSLAQGISKLIASNANTIRDTIFASNAIAVNSHKQLLFNQVNLREFDLKYNLIARNAGEQIVIDDIIRLLRYYMHPDLDGAFLYKFPDEFDIEFYTLDENGIAVRNKYLPFFSTCILTNMTVNYGGKDFVTHKDGSPVEYELTLKFKETQILNKTVINVFEKYIETGVMTIQPGPESIISRELPTD